MRCRTKYVKIGWIGIISVDKKQRAVKMRHTVIFGALMLYVNATISGVRS